MRKPDSLAALTLCALALAACATSSLDLRRGSPIAHGDR